MMLHTREHVKINRCEGLGEDLKKYNKVNRHSPSQIVQGCPQKIISVAKFPNGLHNAQTKLEKALSIQISTNILVLSTNTFNLP